MSICIAEKAPSRAPTNTLDHGVSQTNNETITAITQEIGIAIVAAYRNPTIKIKMTRIGTNTTNASRDVHLLFSEGL